MPFPQSSPPGPSLMLGLELIETVRGCGVVRTLLERRVQGGGAWAIKMISIPRTIWDTERVADDGDYVECGLVL